MSNMGNYVSGSVQQLLGQNSILSQIYGGDYSRNFDLIFRRPFVVTPQDMLKGITRMPLVDRCASMDSDAVWNSPPKAITDDKVYSDLWTRLDEEIDLFTEINRADRLLSIYPYSVIVFYFDKDTELQEPLSKDAGQVIAVKVFNCWEASVAQSYTDPSNPKYQEPEFYSLSAGLLNSNAPQQTSGVSARVHESRVIHLSQGNYGNKFFGNPRLLPVWNTFLDIAKLAGASAETFFNVADRGLVVNVGKDTQDITERDSANLAAQARKVKDGGEERIMVVRDTDVKAIGSDAPDPRGSLDGQFKLLAGSLGIPLTQIFGIEVGEASSAQNRAAYARKIFQLREKFAERSVFRQMNLLFIASGLIQSKPADLKYEWVDAFAPSFLEKAETGSKLSRAIANFSNSRKPDSNGNVAPHLMTIDEVRKVFFDLDPLPDGKGSDLTDLASPSVAAQLPQMQDEAVEDNPETPESEEE